MSTRSLNLLFLALFGFLIAWSIGLAAPLIDWLDPGSEIGSYLINKGVLALVIALALWRFGLFAAVGFAPGLGLASCIIGLPLLVLGVLSFFEAGRPALSLDEAVGWGLVVLFVAFTEETLFRGILWKALCDTSIWRRAIATSLLFGLAHVIAALGAFGWSIALVFGLSAAGFGMVFAAMREHAGTIWSVIIFHAVFDMAAISAAGGIDTLLEPGLETHLRFLTSAIVFAAWGSGAIYLVQRRRNRERAEAPGCAAAEPSIAAQ